MIGHSGAARFPHLHFTLVKDGLIYDPFTGNRADIRCGNATTGLWSPPLAYEPVSFFGAGFAGGIPDIEALRIDATAPESIRQTDTDILSFWFGLYGAVTGDKIEIEIIGPDGKALAQRTIIQEQTQPRQYYYVGKHFGKTRASAGQYTGVVTLSRTQEDGKTLIRTHDNVIQVQ